MTKRDGLLTGTVVTLYGLAIAACTITVTSPTLIIQVDASVPVVEVPTWDAAAYVPPAIVAPPVVIVDAGEDADVEVDAWVCRPLEIPGCVTSWSGPTCCDEVVP